MTYEIDDKIYLNSKNIKLMQLTKKLNYKYYRLYIINEAIKNKHIN